MDDFAEELLVRCSEQFLEWRSVRRTQPAADAADDCVDSLSISRGNKSGPSTGRSSEMMIDLQMACSTVSHMPWARKTRTVSDGAMDVIRRRQAIHNSDTEDVERCDRTIPGDAWGADASFLCRQIVNMAGVGSGESQAEGN